MAVAPWDAAQALQEHDAGNETGYSVYGAMLRVCAVAYVTAGLHPAMQCTIIGVAITYEVIKWWNAKEEIPQCNLIQGIPEQGGIIYKKQVVNMTQKPYPVTFSTPTETITGIACVPVSKEIQSPEAKVSKGGINFKTVTIILTPVKRGKWACNISICGKPSTARPAIEHGHVDGV